jgi:DNA-binding response OmpR family regulator
MTSHRILVIDDSMVIRRTVKDMLPPGKFEVIEAKDGVQGMELIKTGNPGLIMLDFFLPKKSGLEVYQEIQQEPRYRIIPLLMMSGRKDEVTEKIPEPFEFFAFLEKPFDQKQLIMGIREAMEKSKKLSHHIDKSSLTEAKVSTQDTSSMATEIANLNTKVAQMETEIANLKKQINQLVTFVKQKLK